MKVFYIKNATTVQELQEISTTVRSVTEIRRAFAYNAQNAILFAAPPIRSRWLRSSSTIWTSPRLKWWLMSL